MNEIRLTNSQARQFILLKHGLTGDYKFIKEQGVLNYIKQAGCIQYDPIDICGKNAELVLQSRIFGFTKDMLFKLLYTDRMLVDYFDKNMSIFSMNDWKYFSRIRKAFKEYKRSKMEVDAVRSRIREIIMEKGFASSKDIKFNKQVDWSWNPTSLSRAALETMYFQGELILHHKKGTIKYYALADEHIPKDTLYAEDPFRTDEEYLKWRILRRIGGVGMLWNKPSDAWLGVDGLKANNRNHIFEKLLEEGKIIEIFIENISDPFYCLAEDELLIEDVLKSKNKIQRTELIAPLDNMLWDRKLIKKIFGFEYKWEIYTPAAERKYGYYVLPVLSGEEFIGRIEAVKDKKIKQLVVKNLWTENNITITGEIREGINDCINRFSVFNDCQSIKFECDLKYK